MGTIKTTNIEPITAQDNGTITMGSSGDTFV